MFAVGCKADIGPAPTLNGLSANGPQLTLSVHRSGSAHAAGEPYYSAPMKAESRAVCSLGCRRHRGNC